MWRFRPSTQELHLVVESPDEATLDAPDNITTSPRGGVVVCEDGGGINRMVGLDRRGDPFDFAQNLFSGSEFAGACYSPDGTILFVNLQGGSENGTGMTMAIRGPWGGGPL